MLMTGHFIGRETELLELLKRGEETVVKFESLMYCALFATILQ